jgi:hypothetical protein
MVSIESTSESVRCTEHSNFGASSNLRWTRFFDLSCGNLEVADKLFACKKYEEQRGKPNALSLMTFSANHNIPHTTYILLVPNVPTVLRKRYLENEEKARKVFFN